MKTELLELKNALEQKPADGASQKNFKTFTRGNLACPIF